MNEKPIKVPINKVDFAGDTDFHIEKSYDISSDKDLDVAQNGMIDVKLSKLIKLFLKFDLEELEKLHGGKNVKIDSELLIDLASFEGEALHDDQKLTWIISGVTLGVFVGLVLFLIFLK